MSGGGGVVLLLMIEFVLSLLYDVVILGVMVLVKMFVFVMGGWVVDALFVVDLKMDGVLWVVTDFTVVCLVVAMVMVVNGGGASVVIFMQPSGLST